MLVGDVLRCVGFSLRRANVVGVLDTIRKLVCATVRMLGSMLYHGILCTMERLFRQRFAAWGCCKDEYRFEYMFTIDGQHVGYDVYFEKNCTVPRHT
jgi:hypothetical protein